MICVVSWATSCKTSVWPDTLPSRETSGKRARDDRRLHDHALPVQIGAVPHRPITRQAMILTPILPEDMPRAIATFQGLLASNAPALAAFQRIAATWPVSGQVDTAEQRADAVALAKAHGIGTLDEPPNRAFMWDGQVIRTEVEATVIVHEVAHWLTAAPERRALYDFGLGPGPETTRRDEAEAVICLDFEARMHEEQQTSLLGILWEAELRQPAILAFLEQNWMESWDRPSTAAFLIGHVEELLARGLIDTDGRPTTARSWADRLHTAEAAA